MAMLVLWLHLSEIESSMLKARSVLVVLIIKCFLLYSIMLDVPGDAASRNTCEIS